MKKSRYIFRLIIAFIGRFKGLILLGVVLGISVFFLISFTINTFIKSDKEIIGVSGRFTPDDLPNFILYMMGQGLTQVNTAGIPEPGLASSWETPDKGKTWIFYLKGNELWHNETVVDSSSIHYEFTDVDIDRSNPQQLIFNLQTPYTPFPSVVAKPTFYKGLIGTGEWVAENILIQNGYVQEILLKNKNGSKKIFKFYPTLERTKTAFKLGQVQKIIDVINPNPFDKWETANVTKKINKNQVVTIFYNLRNEPFKDNKVLRQALAYAIDKRFLGEEKAISPISPNSWAYNPQVKPYEYDPDRADQLLKDVPDEAKNSWSVKLVTTPILLTDAERIARDWERIGIKTTVQVSSIIPSEFDAFLTIFDIPNDPDQYSLWHSTQESTNLSGFSNQKTDKLLEDGRSTLDFEERKGIYLDFQRFLLEELPATFLYHPVYYDIERK